MKKITARVKSSSIIAEVAILFLIGVITTGLLTYVSETLLSGSSVKRQLLH